MNVCVHCGAATEERISKIKTSHIVSVVNFNEIVLQGQP
jgi:hypothetical protein